jgi:Ca2+-binding EF-hand superfamily protein
VTLSTLF